MQADTVSARRNFTIAAIQAATCAFYCETPEDLRGPGRHRPLVHRRQVAMTLCRRLTDHSYPTIAVAFGRDHTTVIYAERSIAGREAEEPQLRAEMAEIAIIAARLAKHHRALGTGFLLRRVEVAAAVGRFIAALGECPAKPPAPSPETGMRDAWRKQVKELENQAETNA